MGLSDSTIFFTGDKRFVALRGLTTLLALSFALLYSKQLGVERRGLLTLVMATNLVFAILFISGISLHLRNIARLNLDQAVIGAYISVVFLFSLVTPLIVFLVVRLYQLFFSADIPISLFAAIIIYSFLSTLIFGIYDTLLFLKSLKIASILDVGMVLVQIALYVILVTLSETSYFVSVLVSQSISYFIAFSVVFLLLVSTFDLKLDFSVSKITTLFSQSSTPILITFTNQLLERVDKIFLGFQTNIGDLGRYSTSQSVMGVSRFIPDSLSKLTFVRNRNFLSGENKSLVTIGYLVIIPFFLSAFTVLLLKYILGDAWVFPFLFLFFLAILELMRGVYLIMISSSIRDGQYNKIKRVSYAQLALGLLVQPLVIAFVGVWGSCLVNILILSLGIFFLKEVFDE